MSFLDDFLCYKNTPAIIKRTITVFDTTGKQDDTTSIIGTYDCIFWKGKQAESVVSERIRTIVDAVAVFDPTEVSDIERRDTITTNGKEYNIIDIDDVGFQGDAFIIALEEIGNE